MRYALVKAGEIKNVIEADADFCASIQRQWDEILPIPDDFLMGVGWRRDGNGVFQSPIPAQASKPMGAARDRLLKLDPSQLNTIAQLKPVIADLIEVLKKP